MTGKTIKIANAKANTKSKRMNERRVNTITRKAIKATLIGGFCGSGS